jgi:hypothetical protein
MSLATALVTAITRPVKLPFVFAFSGVVAIIIGLLVTEQTLGTLFSPDGIITERVYVRALRALACTVGAGLVLVGRLAPLSVLRHLVVSFATLALCFLSLEVVLRVHEWVQAAPSRPTGLRASEHPELFYENTPNFHEDGERKFNSLGMRDEERTFDTSRETIVVVGDSIEAWRALSVPELYPRRLEAMLNRTAGSPSIQVVNLGVTGYSLHQKLAMLQHRGLAWNPRLAIVGYCLNDPIPAGELLAYFDGRRAPPLLLRSVKFLNSRVRLLAHRYGADFYQEIHRPDKASWTALRTDLTTLGRLGTENGFEPVLLIFPLMGDTAADYPWRDIHERLSSVARAAGVTVVDLLEHYKAAGFARVRTDNVHPNALGHQIAARELHRVISESRSARLH